MTTFPLNLGLLAAVAAGVAISSTWWQAPWGCAAALFGFAGLLFGAYSARVKALHKREMRLQSALAQSTAELLQARDKAKAANRTNALFLANMSHELRTPLSAILLISDLLREEIASRNARENLDAINRSGIHMLRIIDDMAGLAKIDAGRETFEIAPCDLGTVVHDVVDMLRSRATEKGLALLIASPPEFPSCVLADAHHLSQVLINLMDNAVNYTEKGTVTLRMNATPANQLEQLLVAFEVEDTGIGIAAEDQERIFEPFVQAGKRSTRSGSGLGLAIARQLTELMGGTIHVDSAPCRGSKFRVELMVARGDRPPARQHESSAWRRTNRVTG